MKKPPPAEPDPFEGSCYIHPWETWDEKECVKRARYAPADHWGNKPPKGLVNCDGAPYPSYGQHRRWNGGRIIEGKLYQSEEVPLPVIPDTYEFVYLFSWGTRIQLKPTAP